jgi:hypothetical protein
MYFGYAKREAWCCIYEFVSSGWRECGSQGVPPPIPPCAHVWAILSENDKDDAWSLLIEWLQQNDVLELLDCLSDSDWCRSGKQYIEESAVNHAPYGKDPFLTRC